MSIIPLLAEDIQQPEELVTAIRARRGGKLLKLDRMLLHSPPFATGWNSFMKIVRNDLTLDPKLAELAICAVAIINGADYELEQHAPEFIRQGGTSEQIEALKQSAAAPGESSLFNPAELAVLQLAGEMTRSVQVTEETMERIGEFLENTQQLVELVGVISAYNMVSRYLVALGLQSE